MASSSQVKKLDVKCKHDIFLSHSGQEKPFVEQLYQDLKRVNHHPFFDQDSDCLPKAEKFAPKILEAAEQCRLGVVVVSKGYLTSKWPMLELRKFVEREVKLFPLFLNVSPNDLKETEVERKWKQRWRQLVERGEVKEEELELWSEAVKHLRSYNGLEYARFANSEYKYRSAVVDEICKRLQPSVLEWSKSDHIQIISSMFKAVVIEKDKKVHEYLGLYGMVGMGKTTLCEAMCSYSQDEFGGRVSHVKLSSDQGNEGRVGEKRFARLKQVIQELAGLNKSITDSISSDEQGWECLKNGLRNQPPVLVAIDNVGDSEDSQDEARSYVNAGLPSGSKVLVTARSQVILERVLGQADYCEPIPRLEHDEAAKLLLLKAAPKKSSLTDTVYEIMERCLRECRFTDTGYPSRQFHDPLVSTALITYFQEVDSDNVMSKLQRFGEAKHVNDILGLNYHSLSDQLKLVFLDSALYPFYGSVPLPWWSKEERTDFDLWVSWLSQVHGVTPIDARMMVKELKRLSLLEGSSLKVIVHDLYKEFARVLVNKKGSKEWEWWMSREEMGSSNVIQLKRLVLHKDKSIIGCTPKKLHKWRSLIFLELNSCDDIGPDIELGGLSSLRVLSVWDCESVRQILCSCDNGYNDQVCCYGRKPGRGCMSELRFVYLGHLSSVEGIPFLRHCSNLEELRISDCNEAIYPTTNVDSESHGAINLGYLKALRILSMIGGQTMPGYDVNAFIRWLLNALELENLTAFEYVILEKTWKEGVGGYTIDLNILAPLPSRLSVLSLCLPEDIEKVEGLHRLSELTTLNLNWCQGLRELPDLRELPKLKWICVHGCCKLEASPSLGIGVQEIGDLTPTGSFSISHDYWSKFFKGHKCLRPYCYQKACLKCRNRMEGETP